MLIRCGARQAPLGEAQGFGYLVIIGVLLEPLACFEHGTFEVRPDRGLQLEDELATGDLHGIWWGYPSARHSRDSLAERTRDRVI